MNNMFLFDEEPYKGNVGDQKRKEIDEKAMELKYGRSYC
jgi:hypothetical protein